MHSWPLLGTGQYICQRSLTAGRKNEAKCVVSSTPMFVVLDGSVLTYVSRTSNGIVTVCYIEEGCVWYISTLMHCSHLFIPFCQHSLWYAAISYAHHNVIQYLPLVISQMYFQIEIIFPTPLVLPPLNHKLSLLTHPSDKFITKIFENKSSKPQQAATVWGIIWLFDAK